MTRLLETIHDTVEEANDSEENLPTTGSVLSKKASTDIGTARYDLDSLSKFIYCPPDMDTTQMAGADGFYWKFVAKKTQETDRNDRADHSGRWTQKRMRRAKVE